MPQTYTNAPAIKINNIFKVGNVRIKIAVEILPDNMHDLTIVSERRGVL
tara:strand:- start:55 stop:201 length:147 start_codon:yes stop_codon:yes gene_type:complete